MKILPLVSCAALLLLGSVCTTLRSADAVPAKHGYTVTVEVRVDDKGKVVDAALVDAAEDVTAGKVLTKMALAMALNMQVEPRMKDGKAVATTFRAPFFFPIENDEGPAAESLPIPGANRETAVMPAYPPALREAGVVGGSILELRIDAQGKLTHLTALRSSHSEFEAAAKEALSKWEFKAARKNGEPVESRSRIAIVFETESQMADIKWRIAPRPSFGSFVVIRPDTPIVDAEEPVETPAQGPTTDPQPATPAK